MSIWAKKLWLGMAVVAMLVLPVPNIAFASVAPSQTGEASDILQVVAADASLHQSAAAECDTEDSGHAKHSQGDCCGAVSGLVNTELEIIDLTHRRARNTSLKPGELQDLVVQLFRPPTLA
jgi:hypothetical protein